MDALIRRYQDSDAQGVIDLWSAVLPESAPHNEPALMLRKKLEHDRELLFVAEAGGAIVGAVIGGYDGHRGWIYSLAVAPEHRGQRIGTSLVRRLEAALIGLGCLKANLQVRSSNVGVIRFYERLGYQVEERVSMGKRLYGPADEPGQ